MKSEEYQSIRVMSVESKFTIWPVEVFANAACESFSDFL